MTLAKVLAQQIVTLRTTSLARQKTCDLVPRPSLVASPEL